MKIKIIFLLIISLCLGFHSQAQNCTNITLVVGGPPGTNASFNISTGQVAKVVYVTDYSGSGASLNITVGNNSFIYPSSSTNFLRNTVLPIIVAGPASFSLKSLYNNQWGVGLCTIEVSSPSQSFTPSTAVVIPTDSGGPVNIILESSPDLINWYPSLPGIYGANYTNRFFRVRAQLTQ